MQKGSAKIIIIALVVIVIGGGAYYLSSRSGESDQGNLPDTDTTQTSGEPINIEVPVADVGETADWKKYTDKELGIEFLHPPTINNKPVVVEKKGKTITITNKQIIGEGRGGGQHRACND